MGNISTAITLGMLNDWQFPGGGVVAVLVGVVIGVFIGMLIRRKR